MGFSKNSEGSNKLDGMMLAGDDDIGGWRYSWQMPGSELRLLTNYTVNYGVGNSIDYISAFIYFSTTENGIFRHTNTYYSTDW